jgi:hypothetical protein
MIWLALAQAVGSANQQASSLKIQQAQLGVQSKIAELEGKQYGLNLQTSFNKAMASDAVIGASQMRRGGSVAAVASAAEKQFNWDMDFAKVATDIKMKGYDADMNALKTASNTVMTAGYTSAAVGAYTDYQKSNERKSLLAKKES